MLMEGKTYSPSKNRPIKLPSISKSSRSPDGSSAVKYSPGGRCARSISSCANVGITVTLSVDDAGAKVDVA